MQEPTWRTSWWNPTWKPSNKISLGMKDTRRQIYTQAHKHTGTHKHTLSCKRELCILLHLLYRLGISDHPVFSGKLLKLHCLGPCWSGSGQDLCTAVWMDVAHGGWEGHRRRHWPLVANGLRRVADKGETNLNRAANTSVAKLQMILNGNWKERK